MSAILYPIAPNAESALSRPLGRAARASDATAAAGGDVIFVTEPVGPAFETSDAALAAWAGRIDGPAGSPAVQPVDRYCSLREMVAEGHGRRKPRQLRPVYKAGKRWPAPLDPPPVVWRLSVSYWRILNAAELASLEQARKARRKQGSQGLNAAALRAMTQAPLAPVRPQQPLDIGLFEYRPPEAPHMVIPDE